MPGARQASANVHGPDPDITEKTNVGTIPTLTHLVFITDP